MSTGKSERIPSHDFRAWDKYNADREAESVDNEAKKSSSSVEVSPKGIPTELSETGKYYNTPSMLGAYIFFQSNTLYQSCLSFSCREKYVKH